MLKNFFALLLFPTFLSAAFWNWEYISSKHFQGYYRKGDKNQAIKGLYFLEKYKSKIDSLTGFEQTGAFNLGYHFLEIPKIFSSGKIEQKIPVVFQNMGQANGYANPTKPKISLFYSKVRADGFAWSDNWYRMVAVHEYTHIAQMTAKNGDLLAAFLGDWVSPNIYQPLWLLEGYTVYSESQISVSGGRLNNGIFSAIASSQKFFGTAPNLQQLTFHDYSQFPSSAPYLYGGILLEYLAKTYGEQALRRYVEAIDNQGFFAIFNTVFPRFFMDRAAKKVFGENFHTLYARALADLPAAKIDAKRELDGVSAGSVLEFLVSQDACYYTVAEFNFSGAAVARLYRWENGESELITSLPYADDYDFQLQGTKLFYRKAVIKRGFANIEQQGFGVCHQLFFYDLQEGEEERFLAEAVQSFAVNQEGGVYFTKASASGYGSDLFYKKADGEPELILQLNRAVSQLRLHDEGLILTAKPELGALGIYSWQKGDKFLTPLLNSAWVEISPQIVDGKLYYTANYGKKVGGYCYDLATKKAEKITAADFVKGAYFFQGELYYLGLGKDGYRLCRAEPTPKPVNLPPNQTEQTPNYQLLQYTEHGNAALRNLASILVPDIRLSPLFQQGTDILGSTNYALSFGARTSLVMSTTIFEPLLVSVLLESSRHCLATGAFPVYTSLNFGLANVYLLAGYEYKSASWNNSLADDEDVFAGVECVFNFPDDYLSVNSTYDDEDEIDIQAEFDHYFKNAQVGFLGKVEKINDEKLRWHQKKKNGLIFYSHKIVEINDGLWTPSVFWQDLALKIFADYDKGENSKNSFEVDTKFGAGFVPKIKALQGFLTADLEFGVQWQKAAEHKDYRPEFYANLVLSY